MSAGAGRPDLTGEERGQLCHAGGHRGPGEAARGRVWFVVDAGGDAHQPGPLCSSAVSATPSASPVSSSSRPGGPPPAASTPRDKKRKGSHFKVGKKKVKTKLSAQPAGMEQELLKSLVEVDTRRQGRAKRMEEKKVYIELHEAMEALVHICQDGCRTIGPWDQKLKGSQAVCKFSTCKGVELLVCHLSACKMRVPGGSVNCKCIWKLLELYSRMCSTPDTCSVSSMQVSWMKKRGVTA